MNMVRSETGDVFGDSPPPRVYFQVVIDYSSNNEAVTDAIPEDHMILESEPLGTFNEALHIASESALKITSKFPDSKVVEIEPDELEDEFHLYILDEQDQDIARVGVFVLDLRRITMH